MTTYGDVRTKFIARMNRRDMDTDTADGFLQDAITRIQRVMRIPAMEKSVIIDIDDTYTTQGGIYIPSDYLQLRQITYNDQYELQREDVSVVIPEAYASTGMPQKFCRRGGLWVFSPTPEVNTDDPNQVRIDYYAEFDAMTETDDTTVLTDIASDLMIYAALSYACDHYKDQRGDKFEQRFIQILSDIEAMGDDDETSGSAAVQSSFFYSDDLEGTD